MASADVADIRAKLKSLGLRRDKLKLAEDVLTDEMEAVLREAYGLVPVTEAADLLGIHRTTVYRVYSPLDHGD